MNPTRRYHKQDTPGSYVWDTPPQSTFTVEEGDSSKSDIDYEDDQEAVALRVNHGNWNSYDPHRELYPLDPETGEYKLFTAEPSKIVSLYGTKNVTPKAVEQALALAHQEATKHGPGTLTYDSELSDDSSPMVLRALNKGYVAENIDYPRQLLEADARVRKQDLNYNSYYVEQERANRRRMSDRTTRSMVKNEYGVVEREELPENAGQEAVNRVRKSVARRNAQRELPEPEQEPVTHEGSLWDSASRKDKNSWNEASGIPTTSRAGAFKNYVGGIVSKVRGN